jgi:SCP-2 sterol transfer family protein
MVIDSPGSYFEAVAAKGWEPQLAHEVGTWQFDVDGAGTWAIHVDHGTLQVTQGPDPAATVRIRLGQPEFVRLARGDQHENVLTALLRGSIRELEGDIAFAQKVHTIIPFDEAKPGK